MRSWYSTKKDQLTTGEASRRSIIMNLTPIIVSLCAICSAQQHGTARSISQMLASAERWPVKVGADADIGNVSQSPKNMSVSQLVAMARPIPNSQYSGQFESSIRNRRFGPVETSLLNVQCIIVGAKHEIDPSSGDRDFHIVIADPTDLRVTMIVEIPDPQYVPTSSPLAARIAQVRAQFSSAVGPLSENIKPLNIPAVVTGIGFWDYSHGQTGVAPNAIELHPVLAIQPLNRPK